MAEGCPIPPIHCGAAGADIEATGLGITGLSLLTRHHGAAEALSRLVRLHTKLWLLEDQARSRFADDRVIAETKRLIDRTNAERHREIDALDALLIWPPQHAGNRRRYAETVGEVCDRLAVISLKVRNLRHLANDLSLTLAERENCHVGLVALQRWQVHLQECLVDQLTALAAGVAVVPPRAEIKLYNDRRLNPVTRREDDADP